MRSKNIQNQYRPVNDLTAKFFLQISNLCRRQLIVTDHRIRLIQMDQLPQFLNFSLSNIGSRMNRFPVLNQGSHRLRAGGIRKFCKFSQRSLNLCAIPEVYCDQNDPFFSFSRLYHKHFLISASLLYPLCRFPREMSSAFTKTAANLPPSHPFRRSIHTATNGARRIPAPPEAVHQTR